MRMNSNKIIKRVLFFDIFGKISANEISFCEINFAFNKRSKLFLRKKNNLIRYLKFLNFIS